MIKKLFSSGQVVTLATGQTYTLKSDEVMINTQIFKKADLEIAFHGNFATATAVNVKVGIKKRDGVREGVADYATFGNWEIDTVAQTTLALCIENITTALFINLGAVQEIQTVKVSLTASEIKNLGTTPIDAIPAQGAGKVTIVTQMMVKATWGSVAFDNNNLSLIQNTGNVWIFNSPFPLDFTSDKYLVFVMSAITTSLTTNVKTQITGIDSVATGDSTIDVYITYAVITL